MRAGLRLFALLIGLGWLALANTGARADNAYELVDVLRLDAMVGVLHDEGMIFGAELDQDMLNGLGGDFWATQVAQLYDRGRMADTVRMALDNGMDDDQIATTMAFFETGQGQRIISLETSARQAMIDPEVEQVALETYELLKGSDDQRLAAISRFIQVNDLIERNVAGTLNSSYYFMRGLVDGGGSELSEEQIVADVWAQEDDIRADTESWLFGYLLMAYRPLSDADLEAYVAYSETTAGQALNTALFEGFDGIFLGISHAMGLMVSRAAKSSDL